MIPDEYLNIDTPENVVFGYEIVGIGSRFMAATADTLLVLALQLVALFGFALIGRFIGDDFFESGWVVAIYGLVSFGLLWGYYIFFELRWNGRSPGKKWTGIRVVKQDGTPITLSESIIRNLVRLVDFLPLGYGIGVVAMFIDGRSRRLGDMVAGTLVVREQEEVTLQSVAAAAANISVPTRAPGAAEADVDQWPIHLLSEANIAMAESYLQRHREISDVGGLDWQILQKLMAQMDVTETAVRRADTLYVLAKIVKAYRGREA
ncbi:MAG: RDD family protein [Chloroflexota bacterium]